MSATVVLVPDERGVPALAGIPNVQIPDVPDPQQRQASLDLPAQEREHVLDAAVTGHRHPVERRPADQHRVRAESERLDHVRPPPDPAVEQHLGPPGDGVGHRRQGRHRRHAAVQLAATVIRHDDTVEAEIDRPRRVLGPQPRSTADGRREAVRDR